MKRTLIGKIVMSCAAIAMLPSFQPRVYGFCAQREKIMRYRVTALAVIGLALLTSTAAYANQCQAGSLASVMGTACTIGDKTYTFDTLVLNSPQSAGDIQFSPVDFLGPLFVEQTGFILQTPVTVSGLVSYAPDLIADLVYQVSITGPGRQLTGTTVSVTGVQQFGCIATGNFGEICSYSTAVSELAVTPGNCDIFAKASTFSTTTDPASASLPTSQCPWVVTNAFGQLNIDAPFFDAVSGDFSDPSAEVLDASTIAPVFIGPPPSPQPNPISPSLLPVPEPASFLLLGTGLAGTLLRNIRRTGKK